MYVPSFKKNKSFSVPPEKISTQCARVQESLKYIIHKEGVISGSKSADALGQKPTENNQIPFK